MPCGQNTNPGSRQGRLPGAAPAGGFTLVEVMASVLILSILLAGVLLVYRRTTDGLEREGLRQAAGIVAQRRMEILLDSRQEPNAQELHGQDELDPRFSWELSMTREQMDVAGGRANTAAASVIKATVRVESYLLGNDTLVELERYIGSLEPLAGREMAVPFANQPSNPVLEELQERLGREPTLDEIIEELIRRGEIDENMATEIKNKSLIEELDLPEPR